LVIPYPVEDLMELAALHNVRLGWYPDENCPRGRYVSKGGVHVIFLSPILRRSEMRLRCTLAHELGHAVTGCGAEPIGGDARDEARAMRWARRLLMPDEWMVQQVGRTAWEICEDAGVYQLWAEARIEEMERALLYV
jgi:hypothetical protein